MSLPQSLPSRSVKEVLSQVTPCDPVEFLPLQWPYPAGCAVLLSPSRFWLFLSDTLPHSLSLLPVLAMIFQCPRSSVSCWGLVPAIPTFASAHSFCDLQYGKPLVSRLGTTSALGSQSQVGLGDLAPSP